MPRYEVEIDGRRFEIEAPDAAQAQQAIQMLRTRQGEQPVAAPQAGDPNGPGGALGALVGGTPPPPRRNVAEALRQQVDDAGGAAPWIEGAFSRGSESLDSMARSTARGVPILGALADKADPRPEQDARFAQNHPLAANVLPLVGGIASTGLAAGTGIGKALFGITGPNLPARILAGTTTGATVGGVDAGIRNDWDPTAVGIGAGIGGLTGGAIPAIGQKVGQWFGNRASRRAVPSVEDLRGMKGELYREAEAVGLRVSQPSWSRFVWDWTDEANRLGFSARSHSTIANALDEAGDMMGAANTPTLQNMDRLRQMLRATKPEEREIGRQLIEKLDDYIDGLGMRPGDVISGDPARAADLIRRARDMNGRYRKGELIEQIFERARDTSKGVFTSASMSTALRQEFRNLLRSNPRTGPLRFFTKAEIASIRAVVRGGSMANLMRWMGKLSPRGGLSVLLSPAASQFAVGGPVGFAALPALGEVGRAAGNRLTTSAAMNVSRMIRAGGQMPPPPPGVVRGADEATTRFLQAITVPTLPPLAVRRGVPNNSAR